VVLDWDLVSNALAREACKMGPNLITDSGGAREAG
jgi:hypothetical protein